MPTDPPDTAVLVVSTNPGMEGLVFEELQALLKAAGRSGHSVGQVDSGIRGRVGIATRLDPAELFDMARHLRSAHHLLEPFGHFHLDPADPDPLATIRERVAAIDIPAMADRPTFRVSCERHGEHAFTSPEVMRWAGAGIIDRWDAPVDLENHQVHLRVDVVDTLVSVTRQHTEAALSHRFDMPVRQRVAIKPNVAWAALHLAGVDATTDVLADPFCGSGTILLEAGHLFPELTLWGSDLHGKAVEAARRNLDHNGLGDRAVLGRVDALDMGRWYPEASVDAMVTNPPYGHRMAPRQDFESFYDALVRQAKRVLRPGGRLAVFVEKRTAFNRAWRRAGGFRPLQARVIETSNIFPVLTVLERTGGAADGPAA